MARFGTNTVKKPVPLGTARFGTNTVKKPVLLNKYIGILPKIIWDLQQKLKALDQL